MPRKPPCGCAPASASSAAKMAAKPSGATGFSRNSAAPLSRQVLRLSSRRLARQHHHLLAGVRAAQQLEKLDPIHHRHADVQHHHIHAQLGQQRQRLRVVFRRENVPPPARHFREQPLDAGKEPGIVIHKQERFPFDDFACITCAWASVWPPDMCSPERFVHSRRRPASATATARVPRALQRPLGRRPNRRVGVPQRARERRLGPALAQPAQRLGGGLTQIAVRVAQNREEQADRQLAALLHGGSRHLAPRGLRAQPRVPPRPG